jgi:hypothetical protein
VLKSIGVIALVSISLGQASEKIHWRQFNSSEGFSVIYPSNWNQIGISKDRLDILTSKSGPKGIVIPSGEARIVVREDKNSEGTLSDLIHDDMRGASIVAEKRVHLQNAQTRGCQTFEKVVSEEEAIPYEDVPERNTVPHFVNTAFYCEVNGRRFSILLRNWRGDKRQGRYLRTALRIARSLQISPAGFK